MKRVNTLYRVSTVGQVDKVKDDIPMQRIECQRFIASNPDWILNQEFEEKGVSGYKVSAKNRDKIQSLQEAALNDEFDVLLVFMFDRLGRIENETPFVVQWFVDHGIEVWSVKEGQQRFDHHVDKLLNYIRYWQAAGESEKTSMRVKTRMQQMTSEGIYTGGKLLFGYMLVCKGRLNKKGQEMKDPAKHPAEAEAIDMGANKMIYEGYGTHQVAMLFKKMGFKTHDGSDFQAVTIVRLYRSHMLRGIIVRGGVQSERIPELQILTDEKFFKVQEVLDAHEGRADEKKRIAMTNKSKTLLSGNVFCAHCGCRLCSTSSKEKYDRKDGTRYEKETIRYICYHRSRKLNDCDGASTYKADIIDKYVIEVMRTIFASVTGCPEEEKIQDAYRRTIANYKLMQRRLREQLDKDKLQHEKLLGEIAKSLLGESVYSSDDLSTAIAGIKSKIEIAEKQLTELKAKEDEQSAMLESIIPVYNQFKTWADTFDATTFQQKKNIASALFSKVEIGKGYQIHLELDTTYQTFCEEWLGNQTTKIIA